LAPWPLLVWLLVQLAALSIAAARVPLAAQYPAAGERLAVYLVLAAQVVAAAALMPWLLTGWRAAAVVAVSAWPFLALACFLSAVPTGDAVALAGYLSGWILCLVVWGTAARSRRVMMCISAVASTLAAGGPLLAYLRAEFTPLDASAWAVNWQYGPLAGAFALAAGRPAAESGWPGLLALSAAGVGLLWLRHRRVA
jgi:hypothetical protein